MQEEQVGIQGLRPGVAAGKETRQALAEVARVTVRTVQVVSVYAYVNEDGDELHTQQVVCPVPLRTRKEREGFNLAEYVEKQRAKLEEDALALVAEEE